MPGCPAIHVRSGGSVVPGHLARRRACAPGDEYHDMHAGSMREISNHLHCRRLASGEAVWVIAAPSSSALAPVLRAVHSARYFPLNCAAASTAAATQDRGAGDPARWTNCRRAPTRRSRRKNRLATASPSASMTPPQPASGPTSARPIRATAPTRRDALVPASRRASVTSVTWRAPAPPARHRGCRVSCETPHAP